MGEIKKMKKSMPFFCLIVTLLSALLGLIKCKVFSEQAAADSSTNVTIVSEEYEMFNDIIVEAMRESVTDTELIRKLRLNQIDGCRMQVDEDGNIIDLSEQTNTLNVAIDIGSHEYTINKRNNVADKVVDKGTISVTEKYMKSNITGKRINICDILKYISKFADEDGNTMVLKYWFCPDSNN